MPIYLVQHGIAFTSVENPRRPLTPEGISQVKKIAGVAKNYGISVNQIIHSGKERARETSAIFSEFLGPHKGIDEMDGMGPNDNIINFAVNLIDDNVMYVGHQPFMGKLLSHLVTGSENIPIFKIQNGGIVCLERDDEMERWIIRWALMPEVK